ncbi:DNA repair protein RecN [Paenibacillus senegalensis]|uniref:DNA repair protein RecN n=1 Tax=Paenibacillus senegalensis TaxID=1465766 RepID=UPI000289E8A4|nr:DNA repair protein RecN [Paenibacillus senegalensis]
MLLELSIRNLAVVESVRLTFRQGFHVLTGETGAGKSIIIDAMSLIAGGRGASDLVRHGSEKAEIEALFEFAPGHPVWETLDRLGIDTHEEEHLIIRREVSSQGKSISRINGQLVNLSMLREVGEWLINIHGQHEHQSLLKAERHIQWLDLFGGPALHSAKQRYTESYRKFKQLNKEIKQLMDSARQAIQMQDLYRFQVEEIAAAQLKAGEDEWLLEEKRKLGNAEKLTEAVSSAYEALYGSGNAVHEIGKAEQKLEEMVHVDRVSLQPLLEQLRNAYYQLEDAAHQLRDYREQIEFNPERLDEIEQRLDLISSLRRKYGQTLGEIISYHERISAELALLENEEESVSKLQQEAEAERERLVVYAQELSRLRMKTAKKLAVSIENELKDLHMERTRFAVHIERWSGQGGFSEHHDPDYAFTSSGIDQVEFMISANPGEPLRPLGKIASGGELSRIMLAMKAIFSKLDRIPVLVFDEVDTGVSGRAAQAIAEKMSLLSASCQVFSITHLPQVACMADAHFLIYKEVDKKRTFTRVQDLDEEDRARELSRMLGGVEVTETTLHHAKEMLRMAARFKSAQTASNL